MLNRFWVKWGAYKLWAEDSLLPKKLSARKAAEVKPANFKKSRRLVLIKKLFKSGAIIFI